MAPISLGKVPVSYVTHLTIYATFVIIDGPGVAPGEVLEVARLQIFDNKLDEFLSQGSQIVPSRQVVCLQYLVFLKSYEKFFSNFAKNRGTNRLSRELSTTSLSH
jgi:hypothetical protein